MEEQRKDQTYEKVGFFGTHMERTDVMSMVQKFVTLRNHADYKCYMLLEEMHNSIYIDKVAVKKVINERVALNDGLMKLIAGDLTQLDYDFLQRY